MLVGHQIGLGRQRSQRGPVGLGADRDHLAVGAMGLAPADRQPAVEGAVKVGDRVETTAGDHMVPHNVDLPFHPALAGGPVGGQHIDGEAVVAGERGRLRVQWNRDTGCDMAANHRLGAVIDDRAGHAAEMGERPPVTVPDLSCIAGAGSP
jgi:hypothetical protein